eukprot:CAMPEP_0114162974 /NCGR_PEP_ID=MMETSP0043_2-20121206/29829_1 /TAXON_ID=464988 /ORGANISM="Hemiselmis andersenii, Strain CCMP644" /LENGTH=65 /DNA_ID=CAMNT_0001259421 /DNA_START=417 /DNA_END=610 /DNA_ORIENTATION=+
MSMAAPANQALRNFVSLNAASACSMWTGSLVTTTARSFPVYQSSGMMSARRMDMKREVHPITCLA